MKTGLSQTKNKLIFSALLFIILIIIHFFVLNFYYRSLKKRIENINMLKQKIAESQASQQRETQFAKLANLINQKLGTSSDAVLYNLQQKTNPDFEKVKNLILNKIQQENWKITGTTFNQNEKILNLNFQLPKKDFQKFYDFMIDELLVPKIENLTINQNEEEYLINLILKL